MNSARRGRVLESYTPQEGPPIRGLRRCRDGRWRVHLPSGQRVRFTERDENKAIARAKALLAAERPAIEVPLEITSIPRGGSLVEAAFAAATPRKLKLKFRAGAPPTASAAVDASGFWEAVRNELITRPAHAAAMTGIPALANLTHMPVPQPSLLLTNLITTFKTHNPSSDKAKSEAVKPLQRLIDHAGARTLVDLTTEKLLAFRASIETDPRLRSASTRVAYFGRIKGIIRFGLKIGLDAVQIRAALDRCKVPWTAAPLPHVEPRPISREHFHTLLNAAASGTWRAWLLVRLNLCLHIEEVCGLRWAEGMPNGQVEMTMGCSAVVGVCYSEEVPVDSQSSKPSASSVGDQS
jgi:hypothetical protein